MSQRRTTTSAGGARLWPVLPALLLAVLVPTGCVLWFMSAAMRNERLAVRERLTDAYRRQLAQAQSAIDEHWFDVLSSLDRPASEPAPQVFASVVAAGSVDGAVVRDESGQVVYPHLEVPSAKPAPARSVNWVEAEKLEFEADQPDEAAARYARIAGMAGRDELGSRALLAQARCLVKAGRKDEAVEILTGELLAEARRGARDDRGRLIAPNAMLLALKLIGDPEDSRFADLAGRLATMLNDYSPPAIPSSQRRFLMTSLIEIDSRLASFRTLHAEMLAEQYLAHNPRPPRAEKLCRASRPRTATGSGPDIWCVASPNGRVIGLFRENTIAIAVAVLAIPRQRTSPADVTITLEPPSPQRSGEPFLTVPASKTYMPDWRLCLYLRGDDPFVAATGRQQAAYLWSGLLAVAAILALVLLVGRYISRQAAMARLKNDFVATITHELKTPLASMRVLVDTLLDERCESQGQAREYLSLVAKENERLSRLIDNFLTFSRMERNKQVFDRDPVDVGEVAATAVDIAGDRLDKAGCRVELSVEGDLPRTIGDRDALVMAVLNLLDNARKYSEDDKRISVTAFARDNRVCLSVRDNGIGMSRRTVRRIFDRFYQADQSLSRTVGGCGLGLSIVKFIVDAHGGTIDVESRLGKGSAFTVSLPAADPTPPAGQQDERNGKADG